jgi:hypothetical protein
LPLQVRRQPVPLWRGHRRARLVVRVLP